MTLVAEFLPLQLDQLHREAAILKTEGWRFIQTHAVNTDDGIDLYYSFMKDGCIANYRIAGVKSNQPVPSITDLFLAAFVFENEARELFGVDMRDIAIDFAGAMYAPAESAPMTFIAPEQKEAREKAAKIAAAKAAKAKKAKEAKESAQAEKAVAKPAEKEPPAEEPPAEQYADEQLDSLIGLMDESKAAVVRAALAKKEGE